MSQTMKVQPCTTARTTSEKQKLINDKLQKHVSELLQTIDKKDNVGNSTHPHVYKNIPTNNHYLTRV